MDIHLWSAYASLAALVIVLPGPAAALCMHHSMRHGSRRALATVLGGTLSALVLMGISALGLWQLIVANPAGLEFMRVCGALCLLMLGIGNWRTLAPAVAPLPHSLPPAARRVSLRALCRDGFLLGLSNPKDLLFFGALLPQFLDPGAAQLPQLAVMFATWALIDAVAMGSYAALGQRLMRRLASPRQMLFFQRASALVLVGSGAALGIAHPVDIPAFI